jgi:hypothetical protein
MNCVATCRCISNFIASYAGMNLLGDSTAETPRRLK